jgi:hypothetical protein
MQEKVFRDCATPANCLVSFSHPLAGVSFGAFTHFLYLKARHEPWLNSLTSRFPEDRPNRQLGISCARRSPAAAMKKLGMGKMIGSITNRGGSSSALCLQWLLVDLFVGLTD